MFRPARLIQAPPGGASLALSLSLSAWLSQLPYFAWSNRELALTIGAAGVSVTAAWALWHRWPGGLGRRDIVTGLLLTIFAVYITAQTTVAGGHALWIFVLPTVAALMVATLEERRRAFHLFEFIFLLSLVPGLFLLALVVVGVPLTLETLTAANGTTMLKGPGAVFIESNSQALPWGGFISRLCGMYDEPGMVGTISALMLAVRGFDIRGWRALMLWLAGALSLSLAFVVLVLFGLLLRAVSRRDGRPIVFASLVLIGGLFTICALRFSKPADSVTAVQVERAPGVAEPIDLEGARVRQTELLNNRSLPQMDQLVERYLAGDWRTILFGIASDASVVHGGASAVWTRVLTNHGVVGFLLLVAAFAGFAATTVRGARDRFTLLVFLGSFALSFYQRPVIWLPYNLLVFFGGLAILEQRSDAPDQVSRGHAARPTPGGRAT